MGTVLLCVLILISTWENKMVVHIPESAAISLRLAVNYFGVPIQ